VFGGVVGDAVLPAFPDDVEPGSGQDPHGVGVVVVAGAGALVEVGGPGVVVVGVAGEVDHGAAQLFVHRPAQGDDFDLARLPGGGCGAGQTDQGLWCRIPAAGITDLGQEPSGADGPGSGQGGEDDGVGMAGELVGDLLVEGL
jgi:hypothetical protein